MGAPRARDLSAMQCSCAVAPDLGSSQVLLLDWESPKELDSLAPQAQTPEQRDGCGRSHPVQPRIHGLLWRFMESSLIRFGIPLRPERARGRWQGTHFLIV
jgi:hypothetical protein